MSFILDALRKSEHERQRQTGPALVDTPVAAPKPKSNTWAVAAIALLVVNLAAIGGLLLFKSRDEPVAAAAPPQAVDAAPTAATAAPAGQTAAPAPAAQASITQTAPQPAPVAPPPMLRPAAEPAYALKYCSQVFSLAGVGVTSSFSSGEAEIVGLAAYHSCGRGWYSESLMPLG